MNERLDFAELKAAGKLPSPKGAALRVMHLCQEDTVSMPDLARAIQADPALAGRIIKIANYVNPNKSRPIASVSSDTLLLIGIHAVRQAAMGMSLISNYREGPCKAFDYEQFWSQAVAMGSTAQALSQINRIAPPAEMFNCGLMNGIGRLAFATVRPQAYSDLVESLQQAQEQQALQAQREQFGIDEREMLVLMLQDWGIPKVFQDALYHHRDPHAAGFPPDSRALRLALSLQLAGLLAQACLQDTVGNGLGKEILRCGAELDISPEQLEECIRQAMTDWEEWGKLLAIKTLHYAGKKLTWPADQTTPTTTPGSAEAAPAESPLRILVAGADVLQRGQIEKFLASAGHTVAVTDNGLAAFGMATQLSPQVIIADWLMPGMDGLQLCTDLRQNFPARPLYYILLTPFEDERRRVDAYEAGVDEILRTPVNVRLLAARLLAVHRLTGA